MCIRDRPDIQAADFAPLTRRYGLELIAEKVESEKQVVDILELDIGMGQGHLFGEPRAIKEAVLAETDPPTAVSYTHLDVYKRQAQIEQFHALTSLGVGLMRPNPSRYL